MKRASLIVAAAVVLLYAVTATAAVKTVFGPERFDVKERHGKENRYSRTFQASEGLYLITLQNGEQRTDHVEMLEFTLNGEKLLKEDLYDARVIDCFVKLGKENTFEISVKDVRPSGFRRPPLPPRFVTITVVPTTTYIGTGVFGLNALDHLKDFVSIIQKIKTPGAMQLAVAAANLQNDLAVRSEALRKLSNMKDPDALDYFRWVYGNFADKSEVRSEAALAIGSLGNTSAIPELMRGVVDSDEMIRTSSARALSFFKEDDTKKPLSDALMKLDTIRQTAVIRAIANAGWKPVSTLLELAQDPDLNASNSAIELLGSTGDPRAVDLLLNFFHNPGQHDLRTIISALGESRDRRALEPLLGMATSQARRRSLDGDLATALANLGDQRAAPVIGDMIKSATSRRTYEVLMDAYKKLTGTDYPTK